MQGVAFRDRAVYVERADALVVADVHVGRDEASSVEFPLGERADLDDRLGSLLAHFDPSTVAFAGDVLHNFSTASRDVRDSLADLRRTCERAGADAIAVAGNHDTLLPSIWDGDVLEAVRLDDGTVVCHGHEHPTAEGERYLIGHEHPTIRIEGVRRPCYLHGEGCYRGGDLLVLPAFNRLAAGVEINRRRTADFQSPLVGDADALRPIVYDPESHETLRFPPLGEFRRLL